MPTPTPTPKATPTPSPAPTAGDPPANSTVGEVTVTEDETSSGPVVDPAKVSADPDAVETYYLRPGARHLVLLKGEFVEKNTAGDPVELAPAQFLSFRDKFYTKKEWDAAEESLKAAREAAAADQAKTMESATIDEALAGKGAGTE